MSGTAIANTPTLDGGQFPVLLSKCKSNSLFFYRYVWQYKILLLHLYSYLGALSSAYEWSVFNLVLSLSFAFSFV